MGFRHGHHYPLAVRRTLHVVALLANLQVTFLSLLFFSFLMDWLEGGIGNHNFVDVRSRSHCSCASNRSCGALDVSVGLSISPETIAKMILQIYDCTLWSSITLSLLKESEQKQRWKKFRLKLWSRPGEISLKLRERKDLKKKFHLKLCLSKSGTWRRENTRWLSTMSRESLFVMSKILMSRRRRSRKRESSLSAFLFPFQRESMRESLLEKTEGFLKGMSPGLQMWASNGYEKNILSWIYLTWTWSLSRSEIRCIFSSKDVIHSLWTRF